MRIDPEKWEDVGRMRKKEQYEKELRNVKAVLADFDTQVENERKELEKKMSELEQKCQVGSN